MENEIAQIKINKSQKLESNSNVSVENTNKINKMKDSITDVIAKLFGKFTCSRIKLAMLKKTGFYLVSMFLLNTKKKAFHLIFLVNVNKPAESWHLAFLTFSKEIPSG